MLTNITNLDISVKHTWYALWLYVPFMNKYLMKVTDLIFQYKYNEINKQGYNTL